MTTTAEPVRTDLRLPVLDEAGRRLLFTEARSANSWADVPVTDAELLAVRELAQWGPTAANSNPGRVLFVRPGAGRERLAAHLAEGNRAKTLAAPAVAVLAYDPAFHELMPSLFPGRGQAMRDQWHDNEAVRHGMGAMNGDLYVAYFVLAARAVGLAAGPMAGFDKAGVDGEFFAGSGWRSQLVVNLGHPGADAWFPRLPRPAADVAVAWA